MHVIIKIIIMQNMFLKGSMQKLSLLKPAPEETIVLLSGCLLNLCNIIIINHHC